jgi:hypothetical protein
LTAYETRIALARGDDAALRAQTEKLQAAYREFLSQWAATPLRPGGLGFLHFDTRRQVVSVLMRAILRVDSTPAGVEKAFDALLEAQALGTLARRLNVSPPSLASLRRDLVLPDGGIVAFLPDRDRIHVFALDARTLVHDEAVADEALWASFDALERELSTPPSVSSDETKRQSDRIQSKGRELGPKLFPASIRERLASWKSLTVVGAELLGDVSIENLSLDGDQPLGLRLAVSYLPSLPLGAYLAERAARQPPPAIELALFAAPRIGDRVRAKHPGLRPIELAQSQIDALTAPFARDRVLCVAPEQATRKNLFDERVCGAAVLQIVTHGIFDESLECPAGLQLAETPDDLGELWSDDVRAHESWRAPRLAILSVCGAANGPARSGDDALANVAGALIERGSNCVVVSRYPIELDATIELMKLVHARLAAGDSPAEALRAARVALRASDRRSHPFYASLLRVVGLANVPVLGAKR